MQNSKRDLMVDKSYANNFLGQIHKKKKMSLTIKSFPCIGGRREGDKKRCIHQTTTARLDLSNCDPLNDKILDK